MIPHRPRNLLCVCRAVTVAIGRTATEYQSPWASRVAQVGPNKVKRGTMTNSTADIARDARPATDRQIEFIKVLLAERTVEDKHRVTIEKKLSSITLGQAKELITWMMELPKKPPVVAPLADRNAAPAPPPQQTSVPVLNEGVYVVMLSGEEHYYAVRRHRQTRHRSNPGLYVVSLTETLQGRQWPLTLDGLTQAAPRKLTVEETMSMSIAAGHCQVCGKKLKVDESIAMGIGPVCLRRQQRRVMRNAGA